MRATTIVLRLIAAAGLAFDARIHLRLAPAYVSVRTSTVSQADLFRIEAVLAIIAAVVVVAVPFKPALERYSALLAVLVAGGGLVPLVVYRYYNIGAIGPLPSMYEPSWYPDKTHTFWAQVIATVAGLALLVLAVRRHRAAR
jgi:hypothetical protein